MFGYLRIYKYELTYKNIIKYKNLYCSVCNSLKNSVGKISSLFTNYDATFFLSIFDGMEEKREDYPIVCPLIPFKSKKVQVSVSKSALDYITFVSIYYAYIKAQDNIKDENSLKGKIAFNYIDKNKNAIKIFISHDVVFNVIKSKIDFYYSLENSPEKTNFDELSNAMGEIFGEIFKGYALTYNHYKQSDNLYNLGFNIGEWIYIIDAFDDYFEDRKRNNFNPIFYMQDYNKKTDSIIAENIIFISNLLIKKIQDDIHKIDFYCNQDIFNNIINYGMKNTVNDIAIKKFNYQ
ncbi:MAG: DUF5685 family protein [Ruminococcus sp.]|nr:DUF5685 family protein [Ruminococcus sp.]